MLLFSISTVLVLRVLSPFVLLYCPRIPLGRPSESSGMCCLNRFPTLSLSILCQSLWLDKTDLKPCFLILFRSSSPIGLGALTEVLCLVVVHCRSLLRCFCPFYSCCAVFRLLQAGLFCCDYNYFFLCVSSTFALWQASRPCSLRYWVVALLMFIWLGR